MRAASALVRIAHSPQEVVINQQLTRIFHFFLPKILPTLFRSAWIVTDGPGRCSNSALPWMKGGPVFETLGRPRKPVLCVSPLAFFLGAALANSANSQPVSRFRNGFLLEQEPLALVSSASATADQEGSHVTLLNSGVRISAGLLMGSAWNAQLATVLIGGFMRKRRLSRPSRRLGPSAQSDADLDWLGRRFERRDSLLHGGRNDR